MGYFCENIGEKVIFKGKYSDRKVFICKAGVGTNGVTTDGKNVNYCPFSTIFSARPNCASLKEPQQELDIVEQDS